ncbi:MAG: Spo0E family sporulation regulatory protein-aspartic acid phosphatase [Clostridia bacterium]|nr:Spo0E family sporulation regulatory protein-aspartic acid phosphatase [Clostridia bacterium]
MTEKKLALLSTIRFHQEQLVKMVANQRERLRNDDVYGKSRELDQLIVQYMRLQLHHQSGNTVED